jgi:surfeit locus 1 family protein
MRLRAAGRTFAARPWALALTLASLAGFVALGSWQIDRSREKRALIEAFERGGSKAVPLTVARVDELPRYQRVSASGSYESGRQILLDNMPSSTGQPGYRVLTPLRRPDGGALLLVDRGWVPLGADRSHLPPVAVGAAPRTVTGRLDGLPAPGIRVGEARGDGATGWPLVLNFPVTADVEAALGEPVERRILLLDASEQDGFERAWRPSIGSPPERHLGYAIQWFALALVLLVAFVATSLQPRTPGADDQR